MNHISITTLEAPELDIYARLSEGQLFHYNEQRKVFSLRKARRSSGGRSTRDMSRFLF